MIESTDRRRSDSSRSGFLTSRPGRAAVLAAILATFAIGVRLALPPTEVAAAGTTAEGDAKAHVHGVIEKAYFNGAFNGLDTDAMAKGFHPDFAIFSARGDDLARYEIATWIEGIKKRKATADFDAGAYRMDGEITSLEVTGGAARATIELRKGGTLVYTDYLSLLRFGDDWKIVAKVYHRHEN